jgi:alkanesulfonate monooxygenase SsuD/methylene tetrahydromethanopterin reductase-like flavin-dependent oxidoreductase (luciferase family)
LPYGARRALRYGNGWMAHRSRTQYADVQALLPKFREMAAEAGRDPASVPITIWGAREDLEIGSSATATAAFHAWWSASIPAGPIRSCRNSTAGRR